MRHRFLEIASTPAVKQQRERYSGQNRYAKVDGTLDPKGSARYDQLGADERAFIAARDGFYLATLSDTGWPYVQYRGGPTGFLRVLDGKTLGYADFRGNRQYISTGNVAGNDRVSLFLMDYPHQRRLKIFGHMHVQDASLDTASQAQWISPGYEAHVERYVTIAVEAFDWNCPQHITPRFTETELQQVLKPVIDRIHRLENDNAHLKRQLASLRLTDASSTLPEA